MKAANVVAGDPTQFSEGTLVRAAWQPDINDKAPWVQLDLAKPSLIGQIEIAKGAYGKNPGKDTPFIIEFKPFFVNNKKPSKNALNTGEMVLTKVFLCGTFLV